MTQRCDWVGNDELLRAYHDAEWGRPLHGDSALFEFLSLEGAQAGLSWRTVLARRDHYRRCFQHFDIARCARLSDAALEKILLDPGVIRNRLKVYSVRKNAQASLRVIDEFGSLDDYLWAFVEHVPIDQGPRVRGDVPARTELSDRLSKALLKRGYSFVGSTICYAFLQATGMVNDHLMGCVSRRQD
ncbi:MAG: DNA-3-methyladenine glycosylase I [Tahibacter sp.]